MVGLTSAVYIHFMVCGLKPQHGPMALHSPALQEQAFGPLAFLVDMLVPREFAVERNSEEFSCISYLNFQFFCQIRVEGARMEDNTFILKFSSD